MLLRFIVASIVLVLLGRRQTVRWPDREDWPYFIAGGFIGIFAYMWLFNSGTAMMQSGVSSFIIASAPVFALLFSIFFLKEKANFFSWLGMLTSGGGLIMIASSQVHGFEINKGVFILIGAAVCTALYNIIQRKILRKYTPMESTMYAVLIGTAFGLFFFPDLMREFPAAPLKADLIIIYMGIFPAGLAYLSWSYALHAAYNTANVVMFLYLTPFVAMVIAYFWLGELMPPLALLGGIVVVVGMILTNRLGSK